MRDDGEVYSIAAISFFLPPSQNRPFIEGVQGRGRRGGLSGDEDDAEVLAGLRPLHNHVRELRHNRLQALRGENTDGLGL